MNMKNLVSTNCIAQSSSLPANSIYLGNGVYGSHSKTDDDIMHVAPEAKHTPVAPATAGDCCLAPTTLQSGVITVTISNQYIPIKANPVFSPTRVILPVAPADGFILGMEVVFGSLSVPVIAGGADVFDLSSGTTTKMLDPMYNRGMIIQYEAATGIWHVLSTNVYVPEMASPDFTVNVGTVPGTFDKLFSLNFNLANTWIAPAPTTFQAGLKFTNEDATLEVNTSGTTGKNIAGKATLVAGTVTVPTTAVRANDLIFLQVNTVNNTGSASTYEVPSASIVAGTWFTINAQNCPGGINTSDNSIINWWIVRTN